MDSLNRMSGFFLCAALQVASATCATAAQPDPFKTPPDPYGMVCHREQVTGSYISRRVCRTHEEEAAAQAEAQRTLDQLTRNRGNGRYQRGSGVGGGDNGTVRN